MTGPDDTAVNRGEAATARSVADGSRWRLRNWRLRTKVLAVMLVPLLTALVLAGLRTQSELNQAHEFDQAARRMDGALDTVALIHEMQKERDLVVEFVSHKRTGDTTAMQGQIQQTNAGLAKLQQFVKAFPDLTKIGGPLAQRLAAIQAVRSAATTTVYPDVAVYNSYTQLIDSVLDAANKFTATISDPNLTKLLAAANGVLHAMEFQARQNAILLMAGIDGAFPAGMLDEAHASDAGFNASITSFAANATSPQLQLYADTVTGPEIDDRERIKVSAFAQAQNTAPLDIRTDQLKADAKVATDLLHKVEVNLLETWRTSATQAASDATVAAWRDAAFVLVALLLAVLVSYFVARSLLKPIRVLRRDALDVANRRLPETVQRILADPDPVEASKNAVEPVPVFTREETGQLARSFDAVHDQAVRMATEQALLRDNINSIFVNLSRRSQTLVERQLALIDRLEQDEQDPDQLASLFELDHLATRMRRNSESLLVLSGSGLSRQLSRPVPAAEVVGAAVSEVEHYARVEVVSAPDVTVQGRAVSDLVHLIAELLDNATSFSEPDKKVIVRMAVTRKKELAIQITDSGVGMSEDEIEAANARLSDPPDLDVAVTRRMGLYVVARLAKRHNIIVRLRDNEDIEGGLIARITVPAGLVAAGGGAVPPVATSTGYEADPATKASGIAGAFGGMQRIRAGGGGLVNESVVDRSGEQVAGYPPFMPAPEHSHANGTANGFTDTGGWRIEDSGIRPLNGTSLHSEDEQGHEHDELIDSGVGLFGDPLPEPEATEYTEPVEPTAYVPVTPRGVQELDPTYDAPTERLPIYEAVLSQWFEAPDTGSIAAPHNGGGSTVEDDNPDDADGQEGVDGDYFSDDAANGTNGTNGVELEPISWNSPGDDGWQAAAALLDNTPDTMTTAGLPKRVPKAHLVPGSAGPRHAIATDDEQPEPAPSSPPLPPRSADAVRGRMSSFQQGVRRGRHALIEAYAGEQSASDRPDEEHE